MKGWQPIETAPTDGSWILVFTEGQRDLPNVQIARWMDTTDWEWVDVDENTRKRERVVSGYWGDCDGWPTHWMPLPAPPTPAAGEPK